MSKLLKRFEEDRRMRDTARVVLMADIAHARTTLSAKGFADRVGGRIGDGAKDVFEVAKVHSDDNRGIIAALIGALLLWFAREPIMEILGFDEAEDGDELDLDPAPETAQEPEPEEPPETNDISAPAENLPPGEDDEQHPLN